MNVDELRVLYQSDEFRPFEVHLRSGRRFLVETRDHIWVTPGGTVHLIESNDHQIFASIRIDFINQAEP